MLPPIPTTRCANCAWARGKWRMKRLIESHLKQQMKAKHNKALGFEVRKSMNIMSTLEVPSDSGRFGHFAWKKKTLLRMGDYELHLPKLGERPMYRHMTLG